MPKEKHPKHRGTTYYRTVRKLKAKYDKMYKV